jgi:hypothetical protein
MKISRSRRVLIVALVTLVTACAWVLSRSAANVTLTHAPVLTVDTSAPGSEFARGAVGLSIEASELETDHLEAGHLMLVRLMRLLGPSVLRIGGNSVDLSWWTSSGEPPPPWATNTVTPADLSVLHSLLVATGWGVILGLDLGHFEPARIADEARYAHNILGSSLLGLEIGNEPDDFGHPQVALRLSTYSLGEYMREAEAYTRQLVATVPGVPIYGPALTQHSSWLAHMGAATSMFTDITQHYYPTNGCPGSQPSDIAPQPTAAELLSPLVRLGEDQLLTQLAQARAVTGHPTRIGETNSVSCGGSPSASPVFASALWSLDWALRAVSSGVTGINFHGGLGPCGFHSYSPICGPSARAANAGDVRPQPEYYGLLAASRMEGGRFVPANLTGPHLLPNVTTWATIGPGGELKIAIDDFATTGSALTISVLIPGYTATKEVLIGADTEARRGIVLGTASVTGKGEWHPRPTRLHRSDGSFRVIIRPASAVILVLHRRHRPR